MRVYYGHVASLLFPTQCHTTYTACSNGVRLPFLNPTAIIHHIIIFKPVLDKQYFVYINNIYIYFLFSFPISILYVSVKTAPSTLLFSGEFCLKHSAYLFVLMFICFSSFLFNVYLYICILSVSCFSPLSLSHQSWFAKT